MKIKYLRTDFVVHSEDHCINGVYFSLSVYRVAEGTYDCRIVGSVKSSGGRWSIPVESYMSDIYESIDDALYWGHQVLGIA